MYWAMCRCISKRSPIKEAVGFFIRKFGGFIVCPTCKEGSDLAFALGRLLGSVSGKVYVSVPGDGECLEKLRERMMIRGCVRPYKHLRGGKCPYL